MRRCAKTAAASTDRRISAATPAIAWCSRRSVKILPRNAVWYASNLKRTHQTAEAIWAAGFPKPSEMPHVNAFAEQHLGQWQGMNRAAFLREPAGRQPLVCRGSTNPRPAARVSWTSITASAARIERINAEQAGRDVIAVAHGGTIRAAVGACARRSAGEGPRLRHRQLLGDAARSSRKRQLHRLAAADGQPAALDRGCFAQRDASAGGPGSHAAGDETRLIA